MEENTLKKQLVLLSTSFIASVFTGFIVYPLEVAKTKQMCELRGTGNNYYQKCFKTFSKIFKDEGI